MSETDAPLLAVEGLTTHYVSARGTRVTRAVEDVSFTLGDGETLGIVGESGSGKTTLALSLLRLLPPAARTIAGAIRFEGENLLTKSEAELRHIRGKRMAMILQDPMASLNPLFTIGDQVGEPLRVHEGVSRRGAWERARELLGAVRISAPDARVRNYPHELSGGMRQRIVSAIDGQPPDPAALPGGCAFHPRCPARLERCAVDRPHDTAVGDEHRTACWLHG